MQEENRKIKFSVTRKFTPATMRKKKLEKEINKLKK